MCSLVAKCRAGRAEGKFSTRTSPRPKCSRVLELLVGFRERLLARSNVGTTNRVPTSLLKTYDGNRGVP
jgi:hypothetical protein